MQAEIYPDLSGRGDITTYFHTMKRLSNKLS